MSAEVPEIIEDYEFLYRAVNIAREGYIFEDEKILIKSSAFNDRHYKPSVDRSAVRIDPKNSKLKPSDAIIKILTKHVRLIDSIRVEPNNITSSRVYIVDAIYRPIKASDTFSANLAHSQIESAPHVTNSHFKKLKERLAILAMEYGLVVMPE